MFGSQTAITGFVQLYRWFPSILRVLAIIRPAHPLAPVWLSLLLALEVTIFGRSAEDRDETARVDPTDESKIRFGARRVSMVNCSSSGLRSLNQASPSTWSNGEDRQAKGGRPSCVITRQILPLWTCSLPDYRFRPALCLRHRPARPQRPRLDQRHNKPDGRMGCTSDHGGVSLG